MDRTEALALDARRDCRSLSDSELEDFHDRLWRNDMEATELVPSTPTEIAIAEHTKIVLQAAKDERARRARFARQGGPRLRPHGDRVRLVKEANDLLTVVEQTIGPPDQIKGRAYWWRCPLHQESTPSFKVDPERQSWHCFGCRQHGDVIDFVRLTVGGQDFGRALEILGSPSLERRAPSLEWRCPTCTSGLAEAGQDGVRCERGHHFKRGADGRLPLAQTPAPERPMGGYRVWTEADGADG